MDRPGYALQLAATAVLVLAAERVPHGIFTLPGVSEYDPDSLEAGGRFALLLLAVAIVGTAAVVLSLAWWPGVGATIVAAGSGLGAVLGIVALLTGAASVDGLPGLETYVAQATAAAAGACTLATVSSVRWIRRRPRFAPPRPCDSSGSASASGVRTGRSRGA